MLWFSQELHMRNFIGNYHVLITVERVNRGGGGGRGYGDKGGGGRGKGDGGEGAGNGERGAGDGGRGGGDRELFGAGVIPKFVVFY